MQRTEDIERGNTGRQKTDKVREVMVCNAECKERRKVEKNVRKCVKFAALTEWTHTRTKLEEFQKPKLYFF